jgi:hypothetical protein
MRVLTLTNQPVLDGGDVWLIGGFLLTGEVAEQFCCHFGGFDTGG